MSTLQQWPEASRASAESLHRLLTIDNRNWHAQKSQPQRRAAEQLAAALVQLLDPSNPPNAPLSTQQRQDAIALLESALGWLRGELKDPGCPSHGH
ncbi:DUF6439 family protein [Synechococcus sp. LA31]|uniref:DUF6439 family protein n=1 Tax=Synechococcaceae TaxID=1890426 RepID=UPI002027F596|nr:DUF6439 family protein [Synechococcus sp. LA31]